MERAAVLNLPSLRKGTIETNYIDKDPTGLDYNLIVNCKVYYDD